MSKSLTYIRTILLGLIGIVILTMTAELPEGLDIPRIAFGVNPFIMLLLFGALGMWAAPKLALRSKFLRNDGVDWSQILKIGGIAILVGAVVALLDHLSVGLWRGEEDSLKSLVEAASWQSLIAGVTYGGVTEEILLRWGVLSGLALALSRAIGRSTALDVAIVLAAILFAVGHLPAVFAAGVELSPALLSRILLLNTALGVWFGWLFTRQNLETAMSAHAGFHIGAFILGMLWI